MTKKYIVGVFPQQWWSYAGDAEPAGHEPDEHPADRDPLLRRGWNVGYSGNILANWKAPTRQPCGPFPIGIGVGKVVKFGRLPVKIELAGQYMVTQPGPVGQRGTSRSC